ncbi:8-amino-7-oxononanoate synthase [Paraflavisolibacter sp. H34]|uniref:aminotransferase class I/II-fold pyridoxal phosphate-dependent enzyme n=1 Tax=Huijunlia imazamoxiresistens TaxID=3127457 RepID=UPI0030186269
MSHFAQHDAFLQEALDARRETGLLRRLACHEGLVDFCSNDYLGLAQERYEAAPGETGWAGATGSRLVSGNSATAEETERFLAAYHGAEAALIFNTGYMANVGLFSCIADRHATFVYDEQIHASIIDGMRLSGAKRHKFAHNDTADLERRLQAATGRVFVVVESLYSMDGDRAPLVEMAALCQTFAAALVVDEAHATGLYGQGGRGLVHQYGLEGQVWARIHTFGKAMGLHGAAVLGSSLLRSFLVNHARSFIYTTAPPPSLYAHIRQAYDRLPAAGVDRLFARISQFQKVATALEPLGIRVLANPSPIQAILVPGNEAAAAFAAHLRAEGFFVKAILSPTVAGGTERVRICLHAFNTAAQVDHLLTAAKNYFS